MQGHELVHSTQPPKHTKNLALSSDNTWQVLILYTEQ